ncbi:MAG: glycosyltransferase family 4 protein [Bdellovibrio bacteriovorus]
MPAQVQTSRAPGGPRLWFLVPGDLNTPTGGYRYDGRLIQGLRSLGWRVEHRALDPSFPHPSRTALQAAERRLAGIPDGETVVVDGLALGALPESAEVHGRRLALVGLIHHPLWLETGLDGHSAETLRRSEVRALSRTARVVVTSRATARLLQDQGTPASRIRVVVPGVDPAPVSVGSPGQAVQLLCVATLTPRKGHDLLLRALAGLRALPWQLHCVGSLDRDPSWAAGLLALRRDLGLEGRVVFAGALDEAGLARAYTGADLFVLPTRFEGYGMVVAEALARGLPVVATRTGAIPDLVPPEAGILVSPGEPAALGEALGRALVDGGLRRRLAAGARAAGPRLPTWEDAARDFAAACQDIPSGDSPPEGTPYGGTHG